MINFLSKLHWTRIKVHRNHNSEHYFGFYHQSSPCDVGGGFYEGKDGRTGFFNTSTRHNKLILDLGFTSFNFSV